MTIAIEGGLYNYAALTATGGVVNAGRITLHSVGGYWAQLASTGGTLTNTATGVIEALNGELPTSYLNGAFQNQGSLVVRSNASLQSVGTFVQTGGQMTGEGNFYQAGGLLDLQGGRTTGFIDVAGAALRVGSGISAASFVRSGTQNSLFLGCASPLMTIAIEGGLYNYAALTATGVVVNAGRITLHSVGGYWAQLASTGGTLTNTATGSIEALNGELPTSYLNGSFVNTGLLNVRSNATLSLSGSQFLNLDTGLVTGQGSLNASVAAFINSGTVAPGGTNGSPGTLTINGDFTQTVAGRLNLDLGGLTAGGQYDVLDVNGTATLFGTLNVTRFGGFTPAVGDVFLPVTYNARGGQFSVLNGVDISAALELRPTYLANALELRGAIPTNPPAAAPVIVTSPQGQIASLGDVAAFYVTAGGTQPLRFQWQKGGANLAGETNAVLALFNIQTAQAGGYRVIITNQFGAATSVVAQLTVVAPSLTVYWDGGGDGTNWHNPLNWSNDTLPTPTNDVVIDVAGTNATITHTTGNTTVRSLRSEESFVLAGGSLTVANGFSQLNGASSLHGGTYLQALGSNTVFEAAGVTNLDNASLYVSGGGVLTLPGVQTYRKPGCLYSYWYADDPGSRLVLPNLRSLTDLESCSYIHHLQAQRGGRVELAGVTNIGNGYLQVLADGTNSLVDLSSWTTYAAPDRTGSLTVQNGGEIRVPSLRDGEHLTLTLAGGILPTAQLRQVYRLTAARQSVDASAVTNITASGWAQLIGPGSLNLSNLVTLDNASLYVSGGGVLTLPGVQTYRKPGCLYSYWYADDPGSRLVLPNLRSLTDLESCSYIHHLQAQRGGRVELAGVTNIGNGYLQVLADGTNSLVDLSSWTTYAAPDRTGSLTVQNGGEIRVPSLRDGEHLTLTLAGGILPTAQLRQVYRLTAARQSVDASAVTNITASGWAQLIGPGSLNLSNLVTLDNASLYVSGGGVLTLPGVQTFRKPGCLHSSWHADDPGSRLVLPNLRHISAEGCGYTLFLRALRGGSLELSNVTAIADGYVEIRADGNNSVINLLSLQQTPPNLNTFTVIEQNNGRVLLPTPVDFIVSELTPPPSALAGTLVPVSWVARNQGTNDATRGRTDGIYLSPDRIFGNGNDVFIGHFSAGPLGAGQTQSVAHSVLVPPGLSGGYYFMVMADSSFQHYEGSAETNNVFINTNAVSVSAADLVVTRVTPGTNTAQAGGPLAVEWVVRNQGAAPASAAWSDAVRITRGANSRTLATVPAPSGLGTNGLYTNRVTVTLPLSADFPAGTTTLTIAADASGNQPESNEANNAATASFTLTQPPLPDLVAALVNAPVIATPGQPTTLTVVITNRGAVMANGGWLAELRRSQGNQTNQSLLVSAATELLATFAVSNSLAAGAALTVTQSVVIPADVPVTNAVFAVALDSTGAVAETNETNNVTFAANATALPLTLTLSAPFSEVREDVGTINVLVTRSGDRAQELELAVAAPGPSPGPYPYTHIPAGAASASTLIFVYHDTTRFTDAILEVFADDLFQLYSGAVLPILIRNVDTPRLTLAASPSTISEGQNATITVTRDGPVEAPLMVTLTSSSGANLTVPPSVNIPAGTNRATFPATAADDAAVEANVDYNISAGAAGFASGAVSVRVNDNDAPVLTFRLDTPQVSEGAGATALFGTVERATNGASFARSLYLRLTSSDTNVAILPDLVRMAAYDASVRFPIAPIDNELVDGPRTVILRAYALDGSGVPIPGPGVATNLTVLDDDGPALFVMLDHELVAEGRSPAALATVRRNTPATNAVVVTLASSDLTEATVPASVTLSNGLTSATFPVASGADGATDGSQPVTISASASGFATGSAVLTVTDRDLPDLVVRDVTTAASSFTEEYFSVAYIVRNIGLAAMPSNAVMQLRYFLSRDPYLGNDVIAATPIPIEVPGPIPPGQQLGQTVTLRAPRQPGDWWMVVEADVNTNAVVEAEEYNNATISVLPLRVNAAYTANVLTDVTSAPGGTPIPLRGSIAVALSGLPPAGLPVTIYVNGGGVRRTLAAFGDANGNFTATFQPFANEGGIYEIAAAHPGAPAPTNAQDSFTLYGLRADPSRTSVRVTEGSSAMTTVTLHNLSGGALNGITATVLGAAANLSVSANVAATLPGDGSLPLELNVTANSAAVVNSTFTVRITANGGVTNVVTVDVKVDPRTPRLVALPTELRAGMPRGVQTVVEFDVVNQGAAASGPISVTIPALPWMYIASTNPMPSIAPGETNRVTLVLTPASDLPLLEYNGALALNGTNSGVAVPFHFRALSDAVGSLEVTAVSELTYYAEGSPKVTNATVNLRDAVSRAAVTNATVDAQGRLVLPALREGYYELNVSAPDHNDYRAVVLVIGGQTNAHEAFLARQTVQYVWTVEPTDFEDHYTLTVRSTFETVVPIPRLLVTPSMIDLATLNVVGTNPVQIDLVITNDGLVAARDTRLSFPAHPCWEIKPIIENLGTLSARGSVTVPVLIRQTNSANCRPCQFEGAVTWTLICANRTNGYSTPIPVLNAGDDCRITPGTFGGSGGGGGGGGGGVDFVYFPPTLVETPPCDCAARVKLQIEQEAVVTRDAFKATLDVANNTATTLQNISVQVFVKTRAGEDVTALFDVRTNGLAGVSAVDGTGVIDPHSTGQAKWLLIPTSDAAPLTETNYLVGGRFRYTENGVLVDIPLTAVEIRVLPNPRLLVKYYWQRDVLGDDPFTPEREPSLPFSLAMLLENRGHGLARNVRITSGEPRIVENLSGLLINFDLLASQLEMESITPSFTVNFGELAPGTNKIAQWFLRSTLQGFFDHFEASVQHNDALGNLKLSLFDPPEIYQLIHFVRATGAGNDARPDFLVNQTRDPASLPDALHLSDGRAEPVAAVTSNVIASAVSAGQLTSTLTAPLPGGYAYLRANDPQGVSGALNYRLIAVRRSDGTYLPEDNFWQTDRTFIGGGQRPVRENLLHLFDRDSTGSYTLFYEAAQTLDTTPPVSTVAVLPTSSPSVFSVNWSGADASGVTSYDLFVSQDGGAFTTWLAGTTLTSAQYPGQPGRAYAFYSVATDALGNRESAPGVPDATTVTDFTNAPPVCPALATQTIDEGAFLVLELPATDPNAPPQALTWTLVSGPPGLTVNPQTGVLRWPTGEGNGPSTNVVNYSVCDSYSPPACCPQTLMIIVREVNSAPAIAVVTNRVIAEGARLLIANRATDADLPAQTIRWSKGAGFPTNATLDAVTGVFEWRPTASQGPSTNAIRLIATDNGSPALSSTQSFTVIVRDSRPDFILSLGATNLVGGETTSVPVTLAGEPALGRVSFTFTALLGRLGGFALQDRAADVTSAVLTDLGGGVYSVRFDFSGNNSSANRLLARLAFTAGADGPSVILPLDVTTLSGLRLDGSAVGNVAAVDGEAIVVTTEPVLTTRQTPWGTMALFGRLGRTYLMERASAVTGTWSSFEELTLVDRVERLPFDFLSPQSFYRVQELSGSGVRLAARFAAGQLVLEWPATAGPGVLLESLTPAVGAAWTAASAVPHLTNGNYRVSVPAAGGKKFYRLRHGP